MMNINPDKLASEIKAWKATKEEYDKSHSEWLRGRNIQKLEDEAKETLKQAQAKADLIIEQARADVKKAQDQRLLAEEARLEAEAQKQKAIALTSQIEAQKAATERAYSEVASLKSELEGKCCHLDEEKAKLKKRINRIQETLTQLVNDNSH